MTMKWSLEKRVEPMRAQVTLPGASTMPGAMPGSSAPSARGGMAADGTRTDRTVELIRLLEDLARRLKNSETERQLLWREIEEMRQTMSDLDNKSSHGETAYVQIENKLAHRDRMTEELIDRQARLEAAQRMTLDSITDALGSRDTLESRLTDMDVKAMHLGEQITQVSGIGERIERKFEKISDQAVAVTSRLSDMEKTIAELREALNAKALVVLTDAALAAPAARAAIAGPASSSVAMDAAPPLALPGATISRGASELAQSPSIWRAGAMVALMAIGIGIGFAVNHVTAPGNNADAPAAAPASPETAQTVTPETTAVATTPAPAEPAATTPAVDATAEETAPAAALATAPRDIDKRVTDAMANARLVNDKVSADLMAASPGAPLDGRVEPDKSLPEALKKIETAAMNGNAEAQHDLGAIYIAGHGGVKQNYERAATWFLESAYGGVPNARYNLGVMKHQGLGGPENIGEAIAWYRAAATLNHPEALYNLGIASIEGIGLPYDPYLATAYFLEAAKLGVPEAAYNLGLIYQNGVIGQRAPEAAYFWFALAADKGNLEAGEARKQLAADQDWSQTQIDTIMTQQKERFPEAAAKMLPQATAPKKP